MTHIPFKVSLLRLVFLLLPVTVAAQEARLSDYVDPRIGWDGYLSAPPDLMVW